MNQGQGPIPGQYQGPAQQRKVPNAQTQAQQIAMAEYEMKRKKKGSILWIILFGVSTLIAIVLAVLLLTGAGDTRVARLNDTIESKDAQIAAFQKQIEKLNKAIEDTTVKEVIPTTSLQRVEGSEVPEFWLIEGDFIAPNPLSLPQVSDDINNSYMQVGSKFKFIPSDNWIVKMQGATLELSHPAKIWGKIRALGCKDKIMQPDMQPIIQGFFKGYPATTITYRNLFIDDYVVGMMGKADIKVKMADNTTKDMTINIGFAQKGEYTISFMFLNDKTDAGVAQELIDLLLRSGTYGESKLKLE